MEIETEVCVVGAGPAGSAAAGRLARLGHRVLVVEAAAFPRAHIGESLPPAVLPLLAELGARGAIESAGFLRPPGAIVFWAGEERLRESEMVPGFQVDRGRFDALLLEAATEAGAGLLQPAVVQGVRHQAPFEWSLAARYEGADTRVRCRFLIDAAGSRGILPGCKQRLSPPTMALYTYWRGAALDGPQTRVEAGADQWYWGAPLPDGSFNATVFLDPDRCRAAGRSRLGALYRDALTESRLLRRCLEGRLDSAVRVCSGASVVDPVPAGNDWVKVGEAALKVDPLSSQGVTLAILNGIQAATVAHTILSDATAAEPAVQFYRARIAELAANHAATAAEFYREQAAYTPTRFWQTRAGPALAEPTRTDPRTPPGLDDLIVVAPDVREIDVPLLANDRIHLGRALVCPQWRRPVAYSGGYPIAPILNWIGRGCSVRSFLAALAATTSPQQAVRILDWLWNNGVIVPGVERENTG